MAMRVCPHCGNKVPAVDVVAFTNTIECPHCDSLLTVALPSRVIGAFIGLGVGWLVYGWAAGSMTGEEAWVLPAVYSFLAYSFVYALYIMTTSDLVMRPPEVEEAVPVLTGHAPHGGGGGHH
jgi:hypothetical protein